MLKVESLTCERGGRALFENLSFELEPGQALHLSGPNGAGKSSLIKSLTTMRPIEQGIICWKGADIKECLDQYLQGLLSIGHKSGINMQLSAEQNLSWYLEIAQCALPPEVLINAFKFFGLYGFEDLPAANLSAGQRRRIALCRLLVEQKKLWILDEPFVSLDKEGIESLTGLFCKHLDNKGLLIFSSHQSADLGDRVSTLDLQAFSGEG